MQNLRLKNFWEFFHFQSALHSEFFRGGVRAPTFFGHAKFEVKNFSEFFPLPSTKDCIFQRGCPGTNFSLVMLNLRSKFFWNILIYRPDKNLSDLQCHLTALFQSLIEEKVWGSWCSKNLH